MGPIQQRRILPFTATFCNADSKNAKLFQDCRAGEALIVSSSPGIIPGRLEPPVEVTFDGHALADGAGAAAVLWGPRRDDGNRPVLGRSVCPLAAGTTQQLAEAVAAKAAWRIRYARPAPKECFKRCSLSWGYPRNAIV